MHFFTTCKITFLVGGPWKWNVVLEKSLKNGFNFLVWILCEIWCYLDVVGKHPSPSHWIFWIQPWWPNWRPVFSRLIRVTWDQALFSFLFENSIPAGKAKRECMRTAKIGPDLRLDSRYANEWRAQPRSQSSSEISNVTSPVKLVGKICWKIRTRLQASSGNSDSANWPGYQAVKGLAKQESVRKCPRSFLDHNLFHSVAFFLLARTIMVYFQPPFG